MKLHRFNVEMILNDAELAWVDAYIAFMKARTTMPKKWSREMALAVIGGSAVIERAEKGAWVYEPLDPKFTSEELAVAAMENEGAPAFS